MYCNDPLVAKGFVAKMAGLLACGPPSHPPTNSPSWSLRVHSNSQGMSMATRSDSIRVIRSAPQSGLLHESIGSSMFGSRTISSQKRPLMKQLLASLPPKPVSGRPHLAQLLETQRPPLRLLRSQRRRARRGRRPAPRGAPRQRRVPQPRAAATVHGRRSASSARSMAEHGCWEEEWRWLTVDSYSLTHIVGVVYLYKYITCESTLGVSGDGNG